MSDWTNEELSAALSEVARRSSVDLDFRALALKDAAAAVAMVSPRALPPDMKIRFFDNSGSEKFVPLPDLVPDIEELSEAELAAIAGGDYTTQIQVSYPMPPTGPAPSVGGGASWHR